MVDPIENTLELHQLQGSAYEMIAVYGERDRVDSPTLPGLSFDARCVFEE